MTETRPTANAGPVARSSGTEIRDSLPRTLSGRILRRRVRATELGADPGALTTTAD